MATGMSQEEVYEAMAKAGISKKPGIYIAPILIGAAFDFVLLGVMWTQLWSYVMSSRRDKRLNRVIVAISTFVATATSTLQVLRCLDEHGSDGSTLAYICHLFAFNFGTYLQFLSWKWLNWYALLDVITTTAVNIFYTHKTYQLYKSRWIYAIIAPFMLAALAGGVGSKVVAGSYLTDSTQANDLRPYFFLWIGSVLAVGVLLTGLIMFKLAKAKTGDHMDRVLDRFILLAVETQLPATLSAIAFMVSYAIEANSAMNIFFELFHPKIYVVGMLAVLNSRRAIRKILHPNEVASRKQIGVESGLPPRFEQETMSMSTIEYTRNPSALSLDIRYKPPLDQQTSYTYGDGTEWTSSDGSTAIGSPAVPFPKLAVLRDEEETRSR